MKKTWKRIMCGVLSLGLASTLVVEQALRSASDELTSAAVSGVGFKDVTGTIDTSSLRESNFNDSVLKAEENFLITTISLIFMSEIWFTLTENSKDKKAEWLISTIISK